MLTVEQRHALIVCFEETVASTHNLATVRMTPGEHRVDATLRHAIAAELAKRDFYELLNSITD